MVIIYIIFEKDAYNHMHNLKYLENKIEFIYLTYKLCN